MRKFASAIAVLLCVFVICGCVGKKKEPPDGEQTVSNDAKLQSDGSEPLRNAINESGCMLGVGFFGYTDSEADEAKTVEFISDSVLSKKYPFLKNLIPVMLEGAELYTFVPANDSTAVTVFGTSVSDNGTYSDEKETPLYSGKPGETVILRCNISEIHSNVLVTVSDGQKSLEFHPAISLENGHVTKETGCCDFSVYEDFKPSAEAAFERLAKSEELQTAMEQGMKLIDTGDTEFIEGRLCRIIALGTDCDDRFVREKLYAVSENSIYMLNAETAEWEKTEIK